MIEIDGSKGEGGGQILRSSLSLSMITGTPFELMRLRGGRAKPGLARQHLTCVMAAKQICDATVEGDELKSQHLIFRPGRVRNGDFRFSIGTAGSTTLVAQTVLPALLMACGPSSLIIEGGTHNTMAPPFDFLQRSFLPLVARMGPTVFAEMKHYGFYPNGGGQIELLIKPPDKWRGLKLLERGQLVPSVTAIVSRLPASIGQRECRTICKKSNWPMTSSRVIEVENPCGPGNVVLIELKSAGVTEIFSGVGELGVRAEKVARRVLQEAEEFLATDVPVGPHLADQLLLPMAIAATHGAHSRFRTLSLTPHSQTHIDIIRRFLDIEVVTSEISSNTLEVVVRRVE